MDWNWREGIVIDRTQGARLQLLQTHHAEELFELIERNRDRLRVWLPWLDDNTSIEDSKEFISHGLEKFRDAAGLHAGIWLNGKLAGVISLHLIDQKEGKTEIGYWIDREAEGRGLVTKACTTLIEYAFRALNLELVEIYCEAENRRSWTIPMHLGFSKQGARATTWLYDHYIVEERYVISISEWQSRP